jgi:hypothetical protein
MADLLGQGEHDMEVRYGQKLRLTLFQPSGARCSLALGTMPIAARNGELTITCLMGSIF